MGEALVGSLWTGRDLWAANIRGRASEGEGVEVVALLAVFRVSSC